MMDNNNWRPSPPGASNGKAVPDALAVPDAEDWRSHLPTESRNRVVNKIMDTLKRCLPFSGQEGLLELEKIAVRIEEENFHSASSQADYLRKISLKMLTMESKSQNPVANPMQSNSAANNNNLPDPVPLDSTTQAGQGSGSDRQEETYQKIKSLKEMYLPELNEMYQKITSKVLEHDSFPQQPKQEQIEKLKIFQAMVERLTNFLQLTKDGINPPLRDKLPLYEKQIVHFLNNNRLERSHGQLPLYHIPPMQPQQSQSQAGQFQSNENQMNPQLQLMNFQLQRMNLQGSVGSMQQNTSAGMQHGSIFSFSGLTNAQQPTMSSLQPNLEWSMRTYTEIDEMVEENEV